jgi:glycosyltransferase involved in cell wall biosynthesis
LINDRYGRMWEIPYWLARDGHQVRGLASDYYGRGDVQAEDVDALPLAWRSLPLRSLNGWASARFLRELAGDINKFRPDLIWVASDVYHVVLGIRMGLRYGIPVVADLYDNYESFRAARLLPGARWFFRRALKRATAVTCVSHPLARRVIAHRRDSKKVVVIENAVDPRVFRPLSKLECRQRLGLPADGLLIGVAGALSASRGIKVVADACSLMRKQGLPVRLAVAGAPDRDFIPPAEDESYDLGMLDPRVVPSFLNALDVAVVSNIDSEFGRYCFPVKFYEALACGIPVAVASVGALRELLKSFPGICFEPEDAVGLADVIRLQLSKPKFPDLAVPTWRDQAVKLAALFEKAVRAE